MKRGTDVDKSIQLSPKQTAGGAPQVLKKSYFNRTFHPYDWYQKSGTEVSARTLFSFDRLHDIHFLTLSNFVQSIIFDMRVQCQSLLV